MASRKAIVNLAVIVSIAAIVAGAWAYFNRPMDAPPWPAAISGYSFSPFRADEDPVKDLYPSHDEIREDLALLSKQTSRVRTYSVKSTLGDVPQLAREYGMTVVLGIWLSNIEEDNEKEIARAIDVINANRNISLVVVGNESLYRRETEVPRLIEYIERVKSQIKVPVTTAEPWHIWLKHPVLAQHVDVVGAHLLPFWEKIPSTASVDFVLEKAGELKALFPQKPLLLAEVGWPSYGR